MPFSKDINSYPEMYWDLAKTLSVNGEALWGGFFSRGKAINARHKFNNFRKLARSGEGREIALAMLSLEEYNTLCAAATQEPFPATDGTWTLRVYQGGEGRILNAIAPAIDRAARVTEPTPQPLTIPPNPTSAMDDVLADFMNSGPPSGVEPLSRPDDTDGPDDNSGAK